jgi:hypothetical protein
VETFIERKTFTAILFLVALVLGAVALIGGNSYVGMIGLVAGAGAIVHLLVFHV